MNNTDASPISDLFEVDESDVVELSFADHNGQDLGSFVFARGDTVAAITREVAGEAGLPVADRKYEAYQGGRKLPPGATVGEAVLDPSAAVELFPSVTTGGRAL